MRHPRTPIVLRKTWNMETDSIVKAEIVRISNSLMVADTGADADAQKVAADILEQALKSTDPIIKTAADMVVLDKQEAAAVIKK